MWDQPSPMDISFRLFGTRVIIQPWFWVTLALIGWPYFGVGGAPLLLVWVLAGFISILLHEFGHVWIGRVFGSDGHIILRAFGGVAIGSANFTSAWKRIAVTAAGPGIQLVLLVPFGSYKKFSPTKSVVCPLRHSVSWLSPFRQPVLGDLKPPPYFSAGRRTNYL